MAPGIRIPFTITVTGSGVTSVIIQKDTNADGVYAQDHNAPVQQTQYSGPGTYNFSSNESATYTGVYSLQVLVNNAVMDTRNVTVSASCPGTGGPGPGNNNPSVSVALNVGSPTLTIPAGSTAAPTLTSTATVVAGTLTNHGLEIFPSR